MTNRRQFLSRCSVLALTASISPVVPASSFESRSTGFTYAAFSKHVGTKFMVKRPGGDVALELADARRQSVSLRGTGRAPDAAHEKFSLMFRGSQAAPLSQDTYALEHPKMGRIEIFIAPVGPKEDAHSWYQAVFNCPV